MAQNPHGGRASRIYYREGGREDRWRVTPMLQATSNATSGYKPGQAFGIRSENSLFLSMHNIQD